MPTTYAFQLSYPVTDTQPRNRYSHTLHFEHVSGGLFDTDLENMCADLVELAQTRYGDVTGEFLCKAYDTDAKPNYPRASVVVNSGVAHACNSPREVALCLSYSGPNRGNKSERGRMYLSPSIGLTGMPLGERPTPTALSYALKWYTEPNESLPDIGGIDWKFGVYSPTYKKFRQTTQAWVNDEWDTQRRRGLRESHRESVARDG